MTERDEATGNDGKNRFVDWFRSADWFDPFNLTFWDIAPTIQMHIDKAVVARSYVTGSDEHLESRPEVLLTSPGARSGLAMLLRRGEEQTELIGWWPFTTEGVQLSVEVEGVDRDATGRQGIVHGVVGDELALSWYDPLYAVDGSAYAPGARLEMALTGFAHDVVYGSAPPMIIEPGTRAFDNLTRGIGREPPDGPIEIKMEGMAAVMPIPDAPPNYYEVRGPVTSVEPYTGWLFDRKAWAVRAVVARIGETNNTDIELELLITDHVLGSRPPPPIGSDIAAVIRLQGRIWMRSAPNRR